MGGNLISWQITPENKIELHFSGGDTKLVDFDELNGFVDKKTHRKIEKAWLMREEYIKRNLPGWMKVAIPLVTGCAMLVGVTVAKPLSSWPMPSRQEPVKPAAGISFESSSPVETETPAVQSSTETIAINLVQGTGEASAVKEDNRDNHKKSDHPSQLAAVKRMILSANEKE